MVPWNGQLIFRKENSPWRSREQHLKGGCRRGLGVGDKSEVLFPLCEYTIRRQ